MTAPLDVQEGDTFAIDGAVFEVVERFDLFLHLNSGARDLFFTHAQLAHLTRCRHP